VAEIHPTAIVSPAATIAADVIVGPYAVIEGDVVLDDGVKVDHHATINGKTRIGAGCRIYPYTFLSLLPLPRESPSLCNDKMPPV